MTGRAVIRPWMCECPHRDDTCEGPDCREPDMQCERCARERREALQEQADTLRESAYHGRGW